MVKTNISFELLSDSLSMMDIISATGSNPPPPHAKYQNLLQQFSFKTPCLCLKMSGNRNSTHIQDLGVNSCPCNDETYTTSDEDFTENVTFPQEFWDDLF